MWKNEIEVLKELQKREQGQMLSDVDPKQAEEALGRVINLLERLEEWKEKHEDK